MCSCWYEGKSICGAYCQLRWESIQACAATMRTADARDVLYEQRLSSRAFTKMVLSPLFLNCARMLLSKRLDSSGTFELIESDVVEKEQMFATTIFPLTGHIPQVQVQQGSIFRWLVRWHRCAIWLTLKFGGVIQIHRLHLSQQVEHKQHQQTPLTSD